MLNRLSPGSFAQQSDRKFDFHEAVHFLWRQWKFIASIVAVALLIAVVWLVKETPRYTSTAMVLLEPRKDRVTGNEAFSPEVSLDPAGVESQMAIIKSSTFLRRVVEKERLTADPEFGAPQPSGFGDGLRALLVGDDAKAEPAQLVPAQLQPSVEALKGAITVTKVQGYVLAIAVTSADRQRAAKLANAVADGYVVDKLDARFEAAQRASAWLSDRLSDLKNQLRSSEEAVSEFRIQHGLGQGSSVTLNQQQLTDLNAKLVSARADTADRKVRLEFLQALQSRGVTAQSLPDSVTSAALTSLREQERTVAQKETDLASRYAGNHPLLVNARSERRDIQRAIALEMQRLVGNTQNDYDLAKARESVLERTLGDVTGQSGLDDMTSIKLRELERNASVNKSLFEDFLQRARITQEQSTFEAREARVISPALPAAAASYPKKTRTLAIALVLGLMAGVGAALAKEKLNTGFTTVQQVEDVLGVPVLASIGRFSSADLTVNGKVIPIPKFPAVRPLSRFSETLRALRTGIQMTDVDHPPKVIQVTSTAPGEGKTTVAISLAVSAATSGFNVLLIDGDLRHPAVSRVYLMDKDPGLVDVLLGKATLQQAAKFSGETKIWVLPAGSKTQNPTDLLGSERMRRLADEFRKSFDYVIVDSPPVGPVIDPSVIAGLCDKTVYVVRWGATARELVNVSVRPLAANKQLAGVVLNLVDEDQARKYGKGASQYYGSRYYQKYYE